MKPGDDIWVMNVFDVLENETKGFMNTSFDDCMRKSKFIKVIENEDTYNEDTYNVKNTTFLIEEINSQDHEQNMIQNYWCFDHKPSKREFDCLKLDFCSNWLAGELDEIAYCNGLTTERICRNLLVLEQIKETLKRFLKENVERFKHEKKDS